MKNNNLTSLNYTISVDIVIIVIKEELNNDFYEGMIILSLLYNSFRTIEYIIDFIITYKQSIINEIFNKDDIYNKIIEKRDTYKGKLKKCELHSPYYNTS